MILPGLGHYQRATYTRLGLGRYLVHLCWDVARAIRQDEPWALIAGRFDPGKDAYQCNFANPDAEAEADRFFSTAIAPVVRRYPGVFNIVLGINEAFPSPPKRQEGESDADYQDRWEVYRKALTWRARFELRLCRRVQNELRVVYGWGAVSVGCLEADDIPIFADVIREAFCTVVHLYLKPGRVNVAEEDPEREPWWLWRPTRLWLPKLRQMGLRLRLLVTECGPYTADVRGDDLAHLDVEIARALAAECEQQGVELLGVLGYGRGMMGDQSAWELEGSESIFVEAARAGTETLPVVPAQNDEEDSEAMSLREQYPAAFAEWEKAGGVENNFRAHLLGIGAIKPTKEDVAILTGQVKSATEQLANVVAALPFA